MPIIDYQIFAFAVFKKIIDALRKNTVHMKNYTDFSFDLFLHSYVYRYDQLSFFLIEEDLCLDLGIAV